MRYDPSTEIDLEAEADAWFEEESGAKQEILFAVNEALGPYGVKDPTNELEVIAAVSDLAFRMEGLE